MISRNFGDPRLWPGHERVRAWQEDDSGQSYTKRVDMQGGVYGRTATEVGENIALQCIEEFEIKFSKK